jgi:hypothetical protein
MLIYLLSAILLLLAAIFLFTVRDRDFRPVNPARQTQRRAEFGLFVEQIKKKAARV